MALWFAKSQEEVLNSLDTNVEEGLSSQEVEKRLQSFGRNELEVKKQESLLKKVLGQLEDPMIIVLLTAAFLSYVSSGFEDWIDSVIILLIVVINAIISISQENNASKSLEALQKMSAPLAKVIRNGKLEHVETATLVPGDIIELEAGDLVPADARVLTAANLKADESAMTGESVPVNKKALDSLPEDTVLAERKNMLISSTVITNGRATCVVTDTGMKTEVGRIANLLITEDDNTTPLQQKMAEISKMLSIICLGICVLMFIVGLLYHRPILEIFMMAVSLGVAAIPEGLAAIVTIVLALGVQRLVKRHAIVKKLPAVETLGAASVICSDKTGTLTQNKMTIVETSWTMANRKPIF
nr:HAD-IC family P-type ATPase [Enterococcus asini]